MTNHYSLITKIIAVFLFFSLITTHYSLTTVFAEEKPVSILSSYALNNPNLLRRVSLDLRDINIADAIRYLAEKADINVAVSKNVGGRVTLSFKNVTIRDALDIIILSNDLAAEKRGEIIYVLLAKNYETLHGTKWADPRQVRVFKLQYAKPTNVLTVLDTLKSTVGSIVVDNESGTVVIMDTPERITKMKDAISSMDKESLTQVFELKYAKAKEVEENLTSRLDAKGIGSIKADERSNQIVVTTLPSRMKEIENIIASLDKKTRQVFIEAKIIQITLSDQFQMGIEWERVLGAFKNTYAGKQLAGRDAGQFRLVKKVPSTATLKGNFAQALTSSATFSLGTLTANNFTALINVLETFGEVKVLSNPRIAAINNQEAKILVGVREAYTTSTISQTQPSTITSQQISFVDVGVSLIVTPTINKEGFITMSVKPEVSSVKKYIETSQKDLIPIIETATATTTVMVKDGTTILIGGLIKDIKQKTHSGVPIISRIPIVGLLFRSTYDTWEKTELVVLLTPHIITGEEALPELTGKEKESKPFKSFRKYK